MKKRVILRWLGVVLLGAIAVRCSTLPTPNHTHHDFPEKEAFKGDVKRPYRALGLVRSKVDYPSLDPGHEDEELCQNYYNKSVKELVGFAKSKGGDAVIDVKSVVFFESGKYELHSTPECSDDGMEGQILTQGIAIKWMEASPPKL